MYCLESTLHSVDTPVNCAHNAPHDTPLPSYQSTQAQHGLWQAASLNLSGLRHHSEGLASEDSVGHREHPHGAIAGAVADGVSGGACGAVASAAGVNHCLGEASADFPAEALDEAVEAAVAAHTDQSGATTLAAVWLQADGSGQLLYVGDCRIYHWRHADRRLNRLTTDHTFTLLGELPPRHIPPDNPARMLGLGQWSRDSQATPPSGLCRAPVQLLPGDMLLLCSDGLHGCVADSVLGQSFEEATHGWPSDKGEQIRLTQLARLGQRLANAAFTRDGDDDISLLLLRYNAFSHDKKMQNSRIS